MIVRGPELHLLVGCGEVTMQKRAWEGDLAAIFGKYHPPCCLSFF